MPAIVAGHRNPALNKKLAQREADLACSNESNVHRITLPFPITVTRCCSTNGRSGVMSVQFPIWNTIRALGLEESQTRSRRYCTKPSSKCKGLFEKSRNFLLVNPTNFRCMPVGVRQFF
jgi:hypothetical protein